MSDSFTPNWYEQEAPEKSWRTLFKWADPKGFKHPNSGMYALLKDAFGMSDADFTTPSTATDPFQASIPSRLSPEQIESLRFIVGAGNVKLDEYSRTRASYGAGMIDALRLRNHIVENLPDAVLCPQTSEQIEAIVRWCDQNRIPLYIYGGGSSVTRGTEAVKGGVTLDLSVHFTKIVAINEKDQTVTVQSGLFGPELERQLNNGPECLGTKGRYTVGHFPQSFMHASVGGWVVTRGAGQNSTYYGKIEDMVLSQEYVTPVGTLRTGPHPRCATGPDMDQVMMGSEGSYGVLTTVTLRLCKYMPENTQRFSYLFKTWEDAQAAAREVMQAESGFPSVFRFSDPEETDVAMRMYHIHGTPADSVLQTLGYQPHQRCLLIGASDGSKGYAKLVARTVAAVARKYGAFPLSAFGVTKKWEKSRFTDPYMREDLMDFGILTDTLECAVTWDQMPKVHASVRKFIKGHPNMVCMTHLSHAYPQGANLYFIFIARMSEINDYLALQYGILQAIQESGAAMSHHHGIGKQTGPWLEGQIGKESMDVIRALKQHFDPHNVMNPGGTLGLDMNEEQKSKHWTFQK